jgi:glycosyltransferase involved in cell wall biosynthesis
MISMVIPVIDQHEVTAKCLEYAQSHAIGDLEVILVDNGSDPPYEAALRNTENVGLVESLKQGTAQATGDIIVFMHNDVLIHEGSWNQRVQEAFNADQHLGLIGFFGGRGVNLDGGRIHPESNMVGREWGSPGSHHGALQTGLRPAAVLDGLCMIFRKSMLEEEGYPNCPPHHWYDRILPLYYIDRGWRCATIGIAFDHGSGFTSSQHKYRAFAEKWCKEHYIGVPPSGDYDLAIYLEGANQFQKEWSRRLPLTVDEHYNYHWS